MKKADSSCIPHISVLIWVWICRNRLSWQSFSKVSRSNLSKSQQIKSHLEINVSQVQVEFRQLVPLGSRGTRCLAWCMWCSGPISVFKLFKVYPKHATVMWQHPYGNRNVIKKQWWQYSLSETENGSKQQLLCNHQRADTSEVPQTVTLSNK